MRWFVLSCAQLYSTVSEHTGVHAMFAFFALNGLACALFSYYVVFETKGRTFSEIQKILNSSSNKWTPSATGGRRRDCVRLKHLDDDGAAAAAPLAGCGLLSHGGREKLAWFWTRVTLHSCRNLILPQPEILFTEKTSTQLRTAASTVSPKTINRNYYDKTPRSLRLFCDSFICF